MVDGKLGLRSLDLLYDNFENDATLRELEPNVLPCGCDLAQLGHRVKALLGRDHYPPLTAVLLLE